MNDLDLQIIKEALDVLKEYQGETAAEAITALEEVIRWWE